MSTTKFMYLRDRKTNVKIACVAFSISEGKEKVSYQLSTLNADEENFDRTLARTIASGRLVKKPIVLDIPSNVQSNFEIEKMILSDISSSSDSPRRSKQASRLLLKKFSKPQEKE